MPSIPTNHSANDLRRLNLRKLSNISWRIFRIMAEFVDGFEFLSKFSKEVSIFGSARLPESSPWVKEAEKLGGLLAKSGYSVITGGGPAIMQAGNKGAFQVDPTKSIGINIELPFEQRINPYVKHGIGFHYFFTRKVMLAASSQAYIYFPGGIGTLDEFAEILELIQTKKMSKTAIILMGTDFWQPLVDWMANTMVKKYKTVSPQDLKLFKVVDTAEQAMEIVKKSRERTIF